MTKRRLWAVSALDLVFLVLGSVLVIADGFDRGLDHVHFRLAGGAGADGQLSTPGGHLLVAVRQTGFEVDGQPLSASDLRDRARAARTRGAALAIVAAERGVAFDRVAAALAVLRRAGFDAVHFPFEATVDSERSER
ncbi:MAG: hypothetical protein AB7I19_13930 [Planctomycetota bacterium]